MGKLKRKPSIFSPQNFTKKITNNQKKTPNLKTKPKLQNGVRKAQNPKANSETTQRKVTKNPNSGTKQRRNSTKRQNSGITRRKTPQKKSTQTSQTQNTKEASGNRKRKFQGKDKGPKKKKFKVDNETTDKEAAKREKKKNKEKSAKLTLWNGIQYDKLEHICVFFWTMFCESLSSTLTPKDLKDRLKPDKFVKLPGSKWDIQSLLPFLIKGFPDLALEPQPLDSKGSPIVLIVCRSVNRCEKIYKHLKTSISTVILCPFHGRKPEDQSLELKKKVVKIAVGNTSRLEKLIGNGLNLNLLQCLVIDMSSSKRTFNLLTDQLSSFDFFNLYYQKFHNRVMAGQTKLCLF